MENFEKPNLDKETEYKICLLIDSIIEVAKEVRKKQEHKPTYEMLEMFGL